VTERGGTGGTLTVTDGRQVVAMALCGMSLSLLK
jgi:hypothetical protein